MSTISQLSVNPALTGMDQGKVGQYYGDVRNVIEKNFSNSAGQTNEVNTVTPSAVNSTEYNLVVFGETLTYTSDASATATEICTGLKAAFDANPLGRGLGTAAAGATLVITAGYPGVSLDVDASGDSNLANVVTTAGAGASTISFGRGCWYASTTSNDSCKQDGTGLAATEFAGIARYSYEEASQTPGDATDVGFQAGQDAILCRRGQIYVEGGDAADRSDQVWIDRATGEFSTATFGTDPLRLDNAINIRWEGPNRLSLDITAGL